MEHAARSSRLYVAPDYPDAGAARVSLPGGGVQPVLCTLDDSPEALSRVSAWPELVHQARLSPILRRVCAHLLVLESVWPISAVAEGVEASAILPAPVAEPVGRQLCLNIAYAPNASTVHVRGTGDRRRVVGERLTWA